MLGGQIATIWVGGRLRYCELKGPVHLQGQSRKGQPGFGKCLCAEFYLAGFLLRTCPGTRRAVGRE